MSLDPHLSESRAAARKLQNNALTFLGELNASYAQHFSTSKLSEVTASFQSQNLVLQNPVVISALTVTQDAIAQAMEDLAVLTDYITLHIPQMEDGNNFGVTVQLSALKELKDSSETLSKLLDELSKYYCVRADAMDKLKLKSESVSESTKEENDGTETKTTVTKETKSTAPIGDADFHRVQAVYAVDTQYYAIAKKAFGAVKSTYVTNIDFLLKNKHKLEAPKGKSGGSNFSSMY